MLLFEIALPTTSNSGKDYDWELRAWESEALEKAGGFTRLPVADGLWRSPAGLLFEDKMRCYRVACDRKVMDKLTADAFRIFPDQEAIFVSHIGSATITYREKPVRRSRRAPASGRVAA